MHNLFIVRTPLQLLTAYIATYQIGPADNELVLINPRGEKLWQNGYCLKKIENDTSVWKRVMMFKHRLARRSRFLQIKKDINLLKQELLQNGRFDEIYLGSDREFDNQLLVELAGNTSYVRIEDGVWSYSSPVLPIASRIMNYLWSCFVRRAAGLHSKMSYNFRGGGYGSAATADLLYKPQLLQRYSPYTVAIKREIVHSVMERLTTGMPPIPDLIYEPSVIFLGSSIINIGENDVDKSVAHSELTLLAQVQRLCEANDMHFIYKTHPFENQAKLAYYRENLPAMRLISSPEPIEAIFYRYAVVLH